MKKKIYTVRNVENIQYVNIRKKENTVVIEFDYTPIKIEKNIYDGIEEKIYLEIIDKIFKEKEKVGITIKKDKIIIDKKIFKQILEKNKYNFKEIMKIFANKGYIEVYSDGRKDKHTSILGRKARYVTIKLRKEE